jgi:hypothetical protein
MESGKALVEVPKGPIVQLQNKFKELDNGFKAWLSRQAAPVDVAVTTATSAVQGGAIGALMGTLTSDISSTLPTQPNGVNPQAMASLKQAQVEFKRLVFLTGHRVFSVFFPCRWIVCAIFYICFC